VSSDRFVIPGRPHAAERIVQRIAGSMAGTQWPRPDRTPAPLTLPPEGVRSPPGQHVPPAKIYTPDRKELRPQGCAVFDLTGF